MVARRNCDIMEIDVVKFNAIIEESVKRGSEFHLALARFPHPSLKWMYVPTAQMGIVGPASPRRQLR